MRPLIALTVILGTAPALSAQLCYHARPKPSCSAVVFTDFGAYALVSGDDWGNAPWREVADWGVTVNVSERDAVGGSVLATFDRAGLLIGPELRYRRWISSSAALDFGLGMPVVTSTGNIAAGSITGLVRWSPNAWLAVAARPEALRWTTVTSCGPAGCTTANRMHPRLSLGLEVGRVPGAALTGAAGLGTFLLALAIVAQD